MRGSFDDNELELELRKRELLLRAKDSRYAVREDTEVTLGPLLLTGLILGLVLLCGICFGLGYVVGHRAPQAALATTTPPPTGAQAALPVESAHPKPSATSPVAPAPQSADAGPTTPNTDTTAPEAGEATSSSVEPINQPEVRPALPAPTTSLGGTVMRSGSAPMVQIAAVAHQEDADVLVSALRKRGYAVSVSHDAADSLLHVRLGPFANIGEANKWRQKLLSDGYNAILQP